MREKCKLFSVYTILHFAAPGNLGQGLFFGTLAALAPPPHKWEARFQRTTPAQPHSLMAVGAE